jgi:putative ABC transport system permease protein
MRFLIARRKGRIIEQSSLTTRDLVSEAVAGVLQRPARSILTMIGTVLGVGSLVAILGITETAATQIDARFNELTATEVEVRESGGKDAAMEGTAFPTDAEERIGQLNGVRAAGVHWTVRLPSDESIHSTPLSSVSDSQATVVAASPGVLKAANSVFAEGRSYDAYHERQKQRVAVVGASVASRLNITTLRTRPAIFIGDSAFTVIGILDDVERKPDMLLSVVVPRSTAALIWGPPADEREEMLISTQLGAATQVAAQAPVALRPDHPEYFEAIAPPSPQALRGTVQRDLNELFLLLAVVCLTVGAVGIANTTLVAVMERTPEIGLRRALGARGIHITAQFLCESTVLGLFGGVVGASFGIVVTVVVSVVRQWTPVVDPLSAAGAPLLGLVTGLLAGIYPAWQASRIMPAESLRR